MMKAKPWTNAAGESGPPGYADPNHRTGKEHCAWIDWMMANPDWPDHPGVEPDFTEEEMKAIDQLWAERHAENPSV